MNSASADSSSPAAALRTFLRSGDSADRDWRAWAAQCVQRAELEPDDLAALWQAVLEFDPVLARYVRQPVEVDVSAVLVAGSGKESFKTFNVSTAAAILAAAAGAKVIKGVSSSVSAVSGSADVLDHLGVPTCAHADEIPDVLGRDGIAFVRYSAQQMARVDDALRAALSL